MGPQRTVWLLSVLLAPGGLLALDRCSEGQVPTLRLRFDPRKMKLSWDCGKNISAVMCKMVPNEKGFASKKAQPCDCSFQSHTLHLGARFTVTFNSSQGLCEKDLVFHNEGAPGTAAENVSCLLYNQDFMNCTWDRGPAAPADVHYSLYVQDWERKKVQECPQYMEAAGARVGCHFGKPLDLPYNAYFLVNGTSASSPAGIRFFDVIFPRNSIQTFTPPTNITVNCNQSHCVLKWQLPRSQQRGFAKEQIYQVDIRRQDGKDDHSAAPIMLPQGSENRHIFPILPGVRYTLRMRTAEFRVKLWGPWSEPVEFGDTDRGVSLTYVYVAVVLSTGLGALVIAVLLKRFHSSSCLFPPIPGIKDKLTDSHLSNLQVNWGSPTAVPGKADPQEDMLTVVEEAP